MDWRSPERHEFPRIFSTEDERGFVFQETGSDERPYYVGTVDDEDLVGRKGDLFRFASLKDAQGAVEGMLRDGAWKRPKRRYRAYPVYDPKVEGYGNEAQWRATFGAIFDAHPEEAASALGVPAGATWGQIRAAYRRLQMLHHPDRGGDPETFIKVTAAFEKLRAERGRA